ncbi:hypothetical protein OHA21_09845 [Actinoplanes sp. NBC_00393]|uniref:hypothetical protein n=1 Tax=Actinoplanes sp. NBC_00393 TaxID=2975953 RepID=UPI002E1EA73F
MGNHLVVDWPPARNEGDKMLFIFDAGTLGEEARSGIGLSDGELTEWRFVANEDLDSYMPTPPVAPGPHCPPREKPRCAGVGGAWDESLTSPSRRGGGTLSRMGGDHRALARFLSPSPGRGRGPAVDCKTAVGGGHGE